jgi:hypothetical protein
MRTFEKSEREIAQGNFWRAKEILQGALSNAGYDTELFEKLGVVLLKMGDLPEAGKFLFLSGVNQPEYEEAVAIFLRKYAKKRRPLELYRTFPRAAKLSSLAAYPDGVAKKLRDLGLSEVLKDRNGRADTTGAGRGETMLGLSCLLIILAVSLLIILGLIKLKELLRIF